ncbi:hypothetical protein HGRIS_009336 [Hohenbuehelia grisea]|uniref:Uncharacterized protein n=1 Tax=Hohenbuehelia grisea TaxID=104357 RepID=A0ABR3J169_9AGAR
MSQQPPSVTPATPPPKPRPARNQGPTKSDHPSAEELERLGIKVRDFAYESTLPPIAPWVHRQILPSVGPRRENTEPDIEQSQSQSLDDDDELSDVSPNEFSRITSWTSRLGKRPRPSIQPSHFATPPQKQPSLGHFDESQESAYIRTPIVTPNGSLQWHDADIASAGPASQLDGASQIPEPEVMSYSQLGFAPPDESPRRHGTPSPRREPSSAFSSPLSSPPSSLEFIPGGPLASTSAPANSDAASKPNSKPSVPASASLTAIPPDPSSPSTNTRYYLRKRPAPAPLVPATPPRRARRSPPTKPAGRPVSFSVQSAHAAKTKSRPSPVRRRTNTATPVR